MSDQATASTRPPADGLQALRMLALVAVAAGVGLLAAAAFVLSYPGIHAVALYAGVPPRLARIYPLIFDAMLVVACAAVLSLRGAGLPSRCFAWLSLLVLIVTAATADTLYAVGTRLPHKPTAAAVAIIPWALVLIGFGLLLCMLRQARLRQAGSDEAEGLPEPSGQAEAAGLDALFGPKPSGVPQEPGSPQAPAGAEASPTEAAGADAPVTAEAEPAADSTVDLAIDTEPGHDDPASDEGSTWTPETREQEPAGVGPGHNGGSPSAFSPAPTMSVIEAGTDGPEAGTGPEPEAESEPGPGTETSSGPSAEAEAGAQVLAEPGPGAVKEAEAEDEPEAEAGSEPGADPAPVLAASAQSGRGQSAPLSPGA
jgi:hypothetical protein